MVFSPLRIARVGCCHSTHGECNSASHPNILSSLSSHYPRRPCSTQHRNEQSSRIRPQLCPRVLEYCRSEYPPSFRHSPILLRFLLFDNLDPRPSLLRRFLLLPLFLKMLTLFITPSSVAPPAPLILPGCLFSLQLLVRSTVSLRRKESNISRQRHSAHSSPS